jgi:hypothetical protein
MFDLSQIMDPAGLYCLRFRSGAWKGQKTALSLCRMCVDGGPLSS